MRETEWQEHLHLLENILDNLPIAAKVKDVDNDMRYTFINKRLKNSLNIRLRRRLEELISI